MASLTKRGNSWVACRKQAGQSGRRWALISEDCSARVEILARRHLGGNFKNMPKKQNGKKNHCQNRRRNDEVQASRKVAAYAAAYLAIAGKSHIRVRHAHILAFGAACVKQKKRKKCQM